MGYGPAHRPLTTLNLRSQVYGSMSEISNYQDTTQQSSAARRQVALYVVRRFGVYLFTLWAAITVTFFIFRAIPGDPMTIVFGQLSRAQGNVSAEEAAAIIAVYRAEFGLDKPLITQYLVFFRNVLFRGLDFGPSFVAYPVPTRELIMRNMPWTIGLLTTSVIVAWLIGTTLGAILGWLRSKRAANIAIVSATFLQITPVYLVALGLIILVGFQLRWLPARGPYAAHLQPAWTWEFIRSLMQHAILPMLSNVLVLSAGFTLGMRALMISVLGEDHLLYARAKGLAPRTILRDYAFRNALIPQVAGLAIILGTTISGTFIIEVLFGYPGLGTLFVQAMGLRDFNVMQGIVLFSIFSVLTLTLIVDLALPLLDPRIKTIK